MKIGVEIEGTRLTPVRFHQVKKGKSYYIYRCRCGTEKSIMMSNIGNTKSCGCLQQENYRDSRIRRGNRKGSIPWNKGKPGYTVEKARGKRSWRRGKVLLKYPNGSHAWVKVSNEAIGSYSPWYEKPSRAKKKA